MTDHLLPVLDKYTDELVSQVALADAQILEQATAAATEAAQEMAKLPAYRRQEILLHCVKRFRERFEELAYVLCVEAGKPIRDSRGEVTRLIDTFRVAAEEAVRIGGEVLPMDISARASNYRGMWKRVPVGPCALITPFNFPLNLVAHKIAPAIAAGCPFVLKPSSQTPISAILCAEILAETDLPKGAFSILPCRREDAEILALDERFKLLSFTGSPDVGWNLKAKSVRKKVTLELGGNAACIVDRDADLDDAVSRLVFGAFYQSGQSCISVQRIIAHADIYDELRKRLISATSTLKIGDPKREDTFVGPLISKNEAIRIESWIASALANGAKLLFGGKRDGAFIQPALLENVPTTEPLCAKEVFGPVAVLSKFSDFEQALNQVNDSIYGLQAGIFTRDIHQIHKAWDTLEVGGIVIGDIPSWRVDHMPYGGVKNSGIGREGIRFAIEDMTEIRLLVIRLPESYT
jgi:acyl-CoA reductase-like NAD-dependent aldehyde dehydrogenase